MATPEPTGLTRLGRTPIPAVDARGRCGVVQVGETLGAASRASRSPPEPYDEKGTVDSVGDEAVAHDVKGLPISTFGGEPAGSFETAIAARWIADVSGVGNAIDAWPDK